MKKETKNKEAGMEGTAQKKYAWMQEQINKGLTVYVSNHLRHIKITAKAFALVTVRSNNLYLKNDCIDYCRISAH